MNEEKAGIDYSHLVDYSKLDPVKRQALEMFSSTFAHPERLRIRVMPVGEAAAALDFLDYDFMLGFNVEGLGTKNAIADQVYAELKAQAYPNPERAYDKTGQDTVMMSALDLVAIGADPIVYGDFLTAGDDNWFNDGARNRALLSGYKRVADLAGFAIPCGETPVLRDIVNPDTLVLEGASVGLIKPKSRFSWGQKIRTGDGIYGLPSNGLAANGISLVRKIGAKLPEGWFTKLPSGRMLGDAVLEPTSVYVRPIIEMFDTADLHYVSPITGHAWEKVGRARQPFRYVIETLPDPPEVFKFLIEVGKQYGFNVADEKNYFTWNMGTMVSLVAPASSEPKMREIAAKYGTELQVLGHIEAADDGKREVVLTQKGITYTP